MVNWEPQLARGRLFDTLQSAAKELNLGQLKDDPVCIRAEALKRESLLT